LRAEAIGRREARRARWKAEVRTRTALILAAFEVEL